MEYAVLGRTGATVSRLGFGGAALGLTNYLGPFDPHDPATRRQLAAAVDAALAGGITYFDTAAAYGAGTSERILGECLGGVTEVDGRPLVLSTKVHPRTSAGSVRASVEASLERLGRPVVDLVQVHGDSIDADQVRAVLDPGGMLDQLRELQQEGLVRFVGFTSEDNNEAVYQLIRSGHFDTVQLCYNFLFQHPFESSRPFGSLLEAERHGLGILSMRAPTSGTFQRWIQHVNPANTFDYTPALIQYVLSNPLVDVALVGMRHADEVRANVALTDDLEGRVDLRAIQERYV